MFEQEPPKADSERRRSSPEAFTLGSVAAVGLIGFAIAYGLVLDRPSANPDLAAQQALMQTQGSGNAAQAAGRMGPKGEPGPRGERGPRGPTGDPGIRIVREDCGAASCTVKCEDDEVMLTAHCGAGRMPAVFPTEQTALCRSPGATRLEAIGACVKISPR